jgi:hypothetical protein
LKFDCFQVENVKVSVAKQLNSFELGSDMNRWAQSSKAREGDPDYLVG